MERPGLGRSYPPTMTDVPVESTEESPYECFSCGNIEIAETQPISCPDCAGEMRNRRTPLE